MDLCNVICVLIIIGILTVIAVDIHGKQLEKERIREAERKKKIKIIEEHKDNIKHQENAFRSEIQESFYSLNSFDSTIVRLSAIINNIKSENEALKKLSPNEGKDSIIRSLNKKLDQFRELGTKVDNTHFETVVLEDQYGKINKSFWEEIHELEQDNIDLIINDYNRFLKNVDYESFRFIEPGMLPKYVWFYAIQKPYSSEKFQFARDTFYSLYKECYVDLIIAELYAIKQMGGEGVLKERVRDLLKDKAPDNPVLAKFRRKLYCNELETLASGLMWMNAYQEENMILQFLLSNDQPMSAKAQERLHSLSNGGGKAPSSFNVNSNHERLYFDISSLAWNDKEYEGFFENLSFQDKELEYSLVVRNEDKELFITKGFTVPDIKTIFNKIDEVLINEYESSVSAKLRNCIAISGSGEEAMECIEVDVNECKQMSLLIHIIKIGKKLNIKFFTLFMPSEDDLASQKQKAISLYKGLSPSVKAWESSLKDTVLMAIQEVLNVNQDMVLGEQYSDENQELMF